MSDCHELITANSLEDALAGAMWVTALTDASLSADRLHETFMEVIFQFVPEDEKNAQTREEEEQQLQLRTAAERERERRHKEQLRREMRELQARPEDGNEEQNNNREYEEYDDEDEEYEEFDDEFDERGMNAQDQEFLDWIDVTQRFPASSSTEIVHSETQWTQHERERQKKEEDVLSSTHMNDERVRASEYSNAPEHVDHVGDERNTQEEERLLHRRSESSMASEQVPGMSAIELELGNLGLGVEEEAAATDTLPERLRRIAQREHRPRLQSKTLPCGFTYTIAMEHEAYWILRQLRNAGQPLAHNTIICAIANRPQHEIAHEPILAAISFALHKMTREFMEPAYLMLYHQTELHPLLRALLEHSSLLESAEHTLAVPSYAYSRLTGRRQRPYLSDDYVGFGAWSNRSIGEGDFAWNSINTQNDYTQRKPCMMELGRLLVRILELDALCHRLEYRRQQLLIMLHDSPESRVQDQRTLLSSIVFESIAEADVWHTFTQFLTNGRTSGAFHRVRELGLEESFEEYTITGLQFQENLLVNRAVNVCMTPQIPLMDWANQIGRTLRPVRYGEDIISLFNAAIVDQFVRLPILCKQVIDLFCSEGDLIVTYRWVERADDVYPLASFFVEYPRHYLELLQMERQGTIGLYYVLDVHLVRSVLNLHSLYQHRAHNELAQEWNQSREMAMETLAIRLIDSLIPKVKAELHQQALYHMHMDCVERLALLCAEGPYEATYLCLEEYSDEVLTWEPSWNVVEALPLRKRQQNTTMEVEQHEYHEDDNNGDHYEEHKEEEQRYDNDNDNDNDNNDDEYAAKNVISQSTHVNPRQMARVCACYRGENGMTSFCFIDEHGQLLASTRWLDCAMNSSSGRATALLQSSTLEKLFLQCSPSVIAVAASSMQSLLLIRAMRQFVQERAQVVMGVEIPMVWSSCEVARFYISTHYAEVESANMDAAMRMSWAVARYVQDPLQIICALFDNKRTALQMCLSGGIGGGGGVSGSAAWSSKFLASLMQPSSTQTTSPATSNKGNNASGLEMSDTLYSRLEWEMSLWVTAIGFWLDDVVHKPNSVCMLQFVSGLGPSKARVLHDQFTKSMPSSRAEVFARLETMFGSVVANNATASLRVSCTLSTLSSSPSSSLGMLSQQHHSLLANQTHSSGLEELPLHYNKPYTTSFTEKTVHVWHPLDQTLIPLMWYDIATFAAERALNNTHESSLPLLALLSFLELSEDERRRRIDSNANQLDLLKLIREERCEAWESLPGERELELILEEMVACGQTFMRRPYRRLSSHELMYHLTGVTYVSNEEAATLQQQGGNAARHAASTLAFSSASSTFDVLQSHSSIVKEGDYITGTVSGVRGGVLPGIRVSTSRGLRAFINAIDIDDEAMRIELLEHIRHLEDIHAIRLKRAAEREEHEIKLLNDHASYLAPEWVRSGALINGRVIRCNWHKCELLLQWSRPHDMEPFGANSTHYDIGGSSSSNNNNWTSSNEILNNGIPNRGSAADPYANWHATNNYEATPVSYANIIHEASAKSSVNSLKTVQMENDARVFSTKISRHALFRDVSNTYAMELLRDKEIGELLLRPARNSRSKAVCVVKVGNNCMVNWVIGEERRSDGKIYYRLRDKVVEQSRSFEEIDEFLRNYIAAMVGLIHNIRQHRHFTESVHEVAHALSLQEQKGFGFAYTFVESGQNARPPAYRVYTRGGGRDHSFRLHITDAFIYVRLPFRVDGSAPNVAEFKWVQCHNAEHVSETVKKHAILNS